nr:hypothetical protein HAGR004_19100 [Bdellovibrio sp. HAGR004]
MSTKISKDDLKSPDQVTQTLRQGFVWTTAHSKMVITAIAAFVVIGAGASLMSYFSEKKELTQQEKYFLLEKAYTEKKRAFDEASRAEQMKAQTKDKAAPAVDASKKATGDMDKDYGTIVSSFEALIVDAPKTKAAQMAALHLSDIYLTYKKNEEAAAALTKIEAGLAKDDVLTALVLMQFGNVLANKGDCKAAIEKWQALASSKSLAFAHDEAKLRMGLCFESLNDVAKAEELYTEVSKKEDVNNTDFAASKEAEKYLRLLKAKKNL